MNRRATLRQSAHLAMREGAAEPAARPPAAVGDIRAVLDDPALGEALAAVAASGRLSDEVVRAMRGRRRRLASAGAATALLAVVGVGVWQGFALSPQAAIVQHIETGRGEQRTVQLADGSRVELDGATSLDVHIDGRSRTVELRHGEAYFDVAHQPERPFVVRAGGASTRVLGTAFSINMGQSAVRLAVYRGKVRFGNLAGSERSVDVPAGWRSRFERGAASAPTPFDATQLDRHQSWVDTDDMLLGELVEELNRRAGPRIAPPPSRLANLPLSGRFKLDKAEELLSAIGEIYGFIALREGDQLRLKPAPSSETEPSSN